MMTFICISNNYMFVYIFNYIYFTQFQLTSDIGMKSYRAIGIVIASFSQSSRRFQSHSCRPEPSFCDKVDDPEAIGDFDVVVIGRCFNAIVDLLFGSFRILYVCWCI